MQIHEALKQNKKGIKKVTQSFSPENCLNYSIPCPDLGRFSTRSLPSFPPGQSISPQGHRGALAGMTMGFLPQTPSSRSRALLPLGFALELEARETFSKCLLKVGRILPLNKYLLTPSNLSNCSYAQPHMFSVCLPPAPQICWKG